MLKRRKTLKEKLRTIVACSLLALPIASHTVAHADEVETSIEYQLESEDAFLIYNVTQTEYNNLSKEDVFSNRESIFKRIVPFRENRNKIKLTKGDYYLITNESKTLSPIILRGGSTGKVVGKRITLNTPEKPTPPLKPGSFSKTNTESSVMKLFLGLSVLVLMIPIMMVIQSRRSIGGDGDEEKQSN